jgi:hypothetical protein
VLTRWRELSRRDAIIAVQVIVAEEAATAELAKSVETWGVELENGQRVTVGSEAQAAAFARQAGSRPTRIPPRIGGAVRHPEQVKAQLDALQSAWNIDEFIIDTPISDGAARLTPASAGAGAFERGGAAMSLANS